MEYGIFSLLSVPIIDILSELVSKRTIYAIRKKVSIMVKGQVLSSEIVETKEGKKWCVLGVRVGSVLGFIWSRSAYKVGEEVTLEIGTDYQHRFIVRIVNA